MLRDKRRYFIVGAFVIAAILTPPDVISQLSLAMPLMLLYEGSIWSVRMWRRRPRADAAARAAGAAPKPAEQRGIAPLWRRGGLTEARRAEQARHALAKPL